MDFNKMMRGHYHLNKFFLETSAPDPKVFIRSFRLIADGLAVVTIKLGNLFGANTNVFGK